MPDLPSTSGAMSCRRRVLSAFIIAMVFALLGSMPALAKSRAPQFPAVGDVVVAGGVDAGGNALNSAEFYNVQRRKFFPTGSMNSARGGLQAQWFASSVKRGADSGMVAGGFTGSASFSGGTLSFNITALTTVESYTLSTGTFATAADTMADGRALAASIAYPGNVSSASFLESHVLVWGGICNSSALNCNTASIVHPENPSNLTVTATSSTQAARAFEQLTLLPDNTVLATGGIGDYSGDTLNTGEIFDTPNETSSLVTATMVSARAGHTATLLNDGTVLIVGGAVSSGGTLTALNTAEIYDPSSQTFTAVSATMNQPRTNHSATLLANGNVLIAGGFDGTATFSMTGGASGESGSLAMKSGEILNTAEIYNPSSKTFTCVKGIFKKTGLCKPSMKSSRAFQTATALSNGDVLLTGGLSSQGALNTAERFHGSSFKKVGSMGSARMLHAAMMVQQ